jgi:hypothetical protein
LRAPKKPVISRENGNPNNPRTEENRHSRENGIHTIPGQKETCHSRENGNPHNPRTERKSVIPVKTGIHTIPGQKEKSVIPVKTGIHTIHFLPDEI